MEDSLNIGGGNGGRNNPTLAGTFKKWINIDFGVSMIVTLVLVFCITGELPKEIGIPSLIGGAALAVVSANVKKYFLLVVLGIYENTMKD